MSVFLAKIMALSTVAIVQSLDNIVKNTEALQQVSGKSEIPSTFAGATPNVPAALSITQGKSFQQLPSTVGNNSTVPSPNNVSPSKPTQDSNTSTPYIVAGCSAGAITFAGVAFVLYARKKKEKRISVSTNGSENSYREDISEHKFGPTLKAFDDSTSLGKNKRISTLKTEEENTLEREGKLYTGPVERDNLNRSAISTVYMSEEELDSLVDHRILGASIYSAMTDEVRHSQFSEGSFSIYSEESIFSNTKHYAE